MSETTQQQICFQVNGEPFTSMNGMTVIELIREMNLAGKRLAVEINEDIIPGSHHAITILSEGDVVEVVTAIGGG